MTKAERVREALTGGATAKEAAALSGATLQYVYDLKSDMNREKGLPKRRGRPSKKKVATVTTVSDKTDLNHEIEKIMINTKKGIIQESRQEIENLRQEVSDLIAVISYLEHRLKKHGFAV